MQKSINEFKRMSLFDKVILICALTSAAGYLIKAIKQ